MSASPSWFMMLLVGCIAISGMVALSRFLTGKKTPLSTVVLIDIGLTGLLLMGGWWLLGPQKMPTEYAPLAAPVAIPGDFSSASPMVAQHTSGGFSFGFVFVPILLLVIIATIFGIAKGSDQCENKKGPSRVALILLLLGISLTIFAMAGTFSYQRETVETQMAQVQMAQTQTFPRADATQAFEQLTEPQIDLSAIDRDIVENGSSTTIDDRLGQPIEVVDEPPAWGVRPESDYEPDSEYAKQLAKEQGVDYIFAYASPATEGIKRCLELEEERVRNAFWRVLELDSKYRVKDNRNNPLGMSKARLYRLAVKERRLVVDAKGLFTLYTLMGFDSDTRKELRVRAEAAKLADGDAAVELAEGKPAWVTQPPKRSGGIASSVLKVGAYATLDECYAAANRELLAFVFRYLQENRRSTVKDISGFLSAEPLGMTTASLREMVWRDEYVEQVETSVGDMFRLYTLVEITPEDGEQLIQNAIDVRQRRQQADRVRYVGLTAAAVVGVLALVFGLLKVDEMTRGYYSKRLFVGVPLVIIGLLFVLLLVGVRLNGSAEIPAQIQPTNAGRLTL